MIKKILVLLLGLFLLSCDKDNMSVGVSFVQEALAADVNGYTAQYECKAGGANCNVDVVSYGNAACQQIIHTSDAWSTINWAADVICIEAGDHTAKGTLTLGSSGTSGTRKVLRYYRSGDTDDEPWNQSDANKAKIDALRINEKSYWIIHRLTFPSTRDHYDNAAIDTLEASSSTHHIIINRILAEGNSGSGDQWMVRLAGNGAGTATDLSIQNSVLRNCSVDVNKSYRLLHMYNATNVYAVNNEMYNCSKGPGNGFNTTNVNNVIENNDVYNTLFTDCAGNYTTEALGDCSPVKGLIAISGGGTSTSSPLKVIHNRAWGDKYCDTVISCSGGGSPGMALGGGANSNTDWILYKDNIITESGGGIEHTSLSSPWGSRNTSHIGNLMYRMHNWNTSSNAGISFCCSGATKDAHEVYLNTFIDVQQSGWIQGAGITNSDVRCNVAIDSVGGAGLTGSGTQKDYNVFYGTTDTGETHKLGNYTLNTRANSTAYSLGAIIRTTATPPADGTSGDFLYKVTAAGTSAGSPPSYCTTLGCITTDGGVTVRAIRGPYSYYRKLRTGAELKYIPYARMDTAATEAGFCPSGFASRSGIGVDNTQP